MLSKPPSCRGCPLLGLSDGFMVPTLPERNNGVMLIGEALGEEEAEAGKPFVGRAGLMLTRLLESSGHNRSEFMIVNAAWCRPPGNRMDGEPYESGATSHCRTQHWGSLVTKARVLVPMGNVALAALTGRKAVISTRGYIRPGPEDTHIIPTIHPSFILRGMAKYHSAFIYDVQKAVELARDGLKVEFTDYVLDPPPGVALEWAKEYRRALANDASIKLAYDIETPGKGEDEGELADEDDPTYTIHRIGFSYKPLSALSVPWRPEYMAAIRLLLGSDGEKVDWNGSFDRPRVRANGVEINGPIHDGMVAWHVLHSDLPKGLGFVATFTCPWQPEWKHLSTARPAFYNATDADVELRSMLVIERELKAHGLWEVYQRDVLDLDPILRHMESRGMPINAETRHDRAVKLSDRMLEAQAEMERVVPLEARKFEPPLGFVREPEDTAGLVPIDVIVPVKRCSRCGLENPTKPHFRTFKRPTEKKPQNPCAGAVVVSKRETVLRFARLVPFKPSREALMRYQEVMGRPVPQVWDKKAGMRKPSMNKKAIKWLLKKYPDDPLYRLINAQRELSKIAGTYIGYPAERVESS